MVKTRKTNEDSMSAKINKLKRRSGICNRFDPPSEEPKRVVRTPRGKPRKHVEYELPDYTQWFDIDSINYIEEECADNIFIGYGHDKAALHEVYKKVRNKIVELYRIEPTRFLTVTECIRRLGMDASIVMKVHSLLNYWGIINYQAINNFGEKIFNKRLNEHLVNLKGNQSNIHKKRVKLNFNQILDKDSTEANINTYYNNLGYNDSRKYTNCTKRRFDFNSIEDIVRFSSEINSGHYGMNLNYPLCSGCSNPCRTSYYILGPDSLGEVNNTVRNRGLWCSLCYCNSNYPITLSKDSFVRIDLPSRLSETISKLFEKNKSLFNQKNSAKKVNGILDSKRMRSRNLHNEMFEDNFAKHRINKGALGTKPKNKTIVNDANIEEFVSSSNEDDVVGNFMDDNVSRNMSKKGLDGDNVFSGGVDGTSSSHMKQNLKNRLNEISTFLDNRGDGDSTAYGSPVLTSTTKNPGGHSTSNNSSEGTQRSNDDYDSYAGDSYNGSPKIQPVSHNNDESANSHHRRYGTSNNITDTSRFARRNVKLPWTTEDFERLYEAIRKYGTDWQSVAQHMGEDSTPNECVFQFINAPLEKEVTSKLKLTTYMDPPANALLGPKFPFFDSPNTIVTLLSFCASVVSPVVASYAAKAAFNIILKASTNTATNGNKEATQIEALDSNDSSSSTSVYSRSGGSFEDSLNNDDTATFNKADSLNDTSRVDTGEIKEGNSDLQDGVTTEGEGQKRPRVNKFVDGSTLQLAAAAALGAAAARASELAEKEQEKLSEALPNLISLKIKRITEKLNRYNEAQEQMKSDQIHLYIFSCMARLRLCNLDKLVRNAKDYKNSWNRTINSAKFAIFGPKSDYVGDEEWLKPLQGPSRTRWYWPSKYLHMDFTLRHYLAMQISRFKKREDDPTIINLWNTVVKFSSQKDSIRSFLNSVDSSTFSNSITIQDTFCLYYMIFRESPLSFTPESHFFSKFEDPKYVPFARYALKPLEENFNHSDGLHTIKESRTDTFNRNLKLLIKNDPSFAEVLKSRNRFVDLLYLRRRNYYLDKVIRKKKISDIKKKYKSHFLEHPDQKKIWPDIKMSRYSRNKSFDSNYSDTSDDSEEDACVQDKLRNECEGVSNTIICEKLNFPYPPVELDLSLLDDESVWSDLEVENTSKDNLLFELTRELLALRISCLFNALIKNKEYSVRGLYLSKLMIKLNPANYTAWYYRLQCIKTLDLDLEEEIEFARRITFESIKSYQSWNHRRRICQLAHSKFNELEFVKLEIGTSPKNQSAWAYLTWLIKTFGPTDRSDEFEFVDFLVNTDVYNNSAWNYKNFLIRHFDGDLDIGFVLREFARDFQSLLERPDNESLCSYLIDMVSHIERKHSKCINDMDTEYLESIRDKCKSIHCIDSKYQCQHSTL
ncbi:hypothetical protein MACJ_001904 [Theileria orientalis]|uniref:Protein farnesyltransferase/geranylgeranyltransferase type-1 subunit alpha n=1 Tax=Theileria orientalis TaxID=68886 RepID=A0A976QQY3_THEOR|nr:hypothetical protein MACJ_001904 [Theileria orientalis]